MLQLRHLLHVTVRPRIARRPGHIVGRSAAVLAAATSVLVAFPGAASAQTTACPARVDAATFASQARLEALVSRIAGFGLRMPGSDQHNELMAWLEREMGALPGVRVSQQRYTMTRWQPTTKAAGAPGRDLATAGTLVQPRARPFKDRVIDVAGAIPYSKPTGKGGVTAKVVFIPQGTPITKEKARGKIVIRDLDKNSLPYAALTAVAHYVTPDLLPNALGSYERPFTYANGVDDQEAAARAGAVGIVQTFDVPSKYVKGYYDPHGGVLQNIPGIWAGIDEQEQLRRLEKAGKRVRLEVKAEVDRNVPTHNVIATLPGQSAEKIALVTNTDGNTWVQENASAAMLALAEYFSRLPLSCRPKTIEFALTSSHLAVRYDGAPIYSAAAAKDTRNPLSFAFVAEHLGTREILQVPRKNGLPGKDLAYTGVTEPYAWFAPTESPALSNALSSAIIDRGDKRAAVLRGMDLPQPTRVPANCDFGGLANFFHAKLIPAIGGISGPWSLWAPSFGRAAIDFQHYRTQALVIGDTITALAPLGKAAIEGLYPAERALVQGGAPTCTRPVLPETSPAKATG